MNDLAIGLIGCGSIAAKHVSSIAKCNNAKLAALCDVNIERMKGMSALWRSVSGDKQQNEPVLFTDYRQLLAEPSIAVVVIAAISGLHAQIAIEALTANKHVILEKPIALSLRDADEIIRLANERKLIVQVCHQLRYRPLMRKIHELVKEGALGKILAASVKLRIYRPLSYYQTSAWRGTWEHDGGMLLNQGIHAIDLLQWYLGMPTQVYGELGYRFSSKETEDVAFGILSFPGGAKAMIEANSVTMPENLEQSLFVLGEKGVISIGGPKMDQIHRWYMEDQPFSIEEAMRLLPDQNEHVEMYRTLIQACLEKKEAGLVDLMEGRRSLELIFAIYLSAQIAQVAHLPIPEFTTLQMKPE
ncbi:gfo/Idh/MocA family oxidoreductase [Paenibacillus oralis]|uniref:Gfo/Idh/MocA family oxidoreductase n=1 Tax=Paenibacillus oralis TaxID=2490856 RepID=A0A3P3U1P0_9BACL|nr:Gfo/Idh/MocA family oxidoreductase [Paenibacillus oralis]RRJ64265.1 gfo/Idh/MocA family oxidoreductase [Paenibacillus oralis]